MEMFEDNADAQLGQLSSVGYPKTIDSVADSHGRKRRNVSTIDYKALEAGPKIPRSKEFMFFGPSKSKAALGVDKGSVGSKTETGSKGNKNKSTITTTSTTASQEKKKAKSTSKSSIDSSGATKSKKVTNTASTGASLDEAAPKKQKQQPPPVPSDAGDAAPELQWRTQKRANKLIGRRGARVLPCGPRGASVDVFEGKIVGWLPAEPNEMGGHDPALWRFRHDDDGDEEDLDEGEVAAAIEALRVLEARPLPRSRDENWHEFEALATAFANKLAAVADAAAAAAAAAGAAVGAAASSPSTSNALPVPAPLSEVGEGGTLMLSNATPPTDGAAAGHTAVAGPAPIAAATGQISVPPIEASSDGGHIIEKPQNVPPTSSFCSFMAKSTQVLAWDANHAGGVTTANAYPATVLDARPAVTPSATSLNVDTRNKTVPATCSSNDTVQPPASSGSNSMRYSNPNEFEVKLHFHGFNKRYDRWQPGELVVPFDDAAAVAVSKLHPYGVNKAAPPPLPSPSPHKRVLPEGFPPLSRAAEYGPSPAKHLEHLGLAHVKAAMPSEVVDSLASLVEQFFNKATRVVNNLGLQDVLSSTGFTHLKSRSTGRWDLNPPRLLAAAGMGRFNLTAPSLMQQNSAAAAAAAASVEFEAPVTSTRANATSSKKDSHHNCETGGSVSMLRASMHLPSSLEATEDNHDINNSSNNSSSHDRSNESKTSNSSKLDQHLTWLFDGASPPWMAILKEVLGPDCECIAAGCMLSLPGSIAQPLHQDGPHLSKTGKPLDREFAVDDTPPAPAPANGEAAQGAAASSKATAAKPGAATKASTAKASASGKGSQKGSSNATAISKKAAAAASASMSSSTKAKKGRGAASTTPLPPPPSSSSSSSESIAKVKGAKGHVHLGAHAINVFLPLIDLTAANGGTEFYPATHIWGSYDNTTDRSSPIVPLAKAGDAILFDYRIKHRGLANNGDGPRPVVYITYAKPGFKDDANFSARRYSKLPAAAYE